MVRVRSVLAVLIPFALGSFAVGLAAPVASAAVAGAPADLTLDQALAMARKRNRSLTVERARLAQAQTNIDQAWAALFPTVTAQGKYTHNDTEAIFPIPATPAMPNATPPVPAMAARTLILQPQEQLDGVVNANVPLIAPAAYPALEAVKSNVHAAEANFEVSEDQVLFTVAQTFYAAGIADEVLVARHSSVEVARATLENARTRMAAGTVTKVDQDRAELALVRAEQQEREAVTARDQTYRALATLIQAEAPFHVSIPTVGAPYRVDNQSLDMALHLRPEFRAYEETARSADQQRRAYFWKWAPTISGFGQARRFNYLNFAQHDYAWLVGVQLDWVIYDGGARDAQRHLAAAQAEEAHARTEVLRDSINDDLVNGSRSLETKQKALETAQRSVELARETLDLVRVQYEAGSVTQVDLLQAQDSLVAAQEAIAQAHYDVAIADLTLRRSVGTFPGK
jgi:outer membrane protein TolC